MICYDLLIEVMRFLRRDELDKMELVCQWTRKAVEENEFYWPFNRCYRLTFLEVFWRHQKLNPFQYYALNTLARVQNLSNERFQLPPILNETVQSAQFPADGIQIPLFLDETEPTFLLFEFASSRKFFVQLEPFLNRANVEHVVFWLHQMANLFFEEEIRGLLDMRKFSPVFLGWLQANGFANLLHFRCKTLGCYEYEAFDELSIQFLMRHTSIQRLDKANGTIYSRQLLEFLHNGANCCGAFSTRWVMGCGDDFTDNLIQYALNTESPESIVPDIRLTPSFHRQRDLPIPTKSLIPSGNVWLIKREFGDWKYEEWELHNVHKPVRFRLCMYIYNDVETDEEAISQLSIERIC